MCSLVENEKYKLPLPSNEFLVETCSRNALELAVNYSFEGTQDDGHWCGELK